VSSPIAKARKTGIDQALIATHQRLSHSSRIDILADQFAARIVAVAAPALERPVRVLDVGCGDMTLADAVAERLPGVEFNCVDIHPLPAALAEKDARWERYKCFDGRTLPFGDMHFDVVMFSDVLHHVPPNLRLPLLTSAGRVGRNVIVKDHFEYGWWSRQALRAMDCVGNFGYGVSVPARYFDCPSFEALCSGAGLTVEQLDVGLQLYGHLPLVRSLLQQKWQFFAICRLDAAANRF
jgi:SAM-dependent methyltransferase